MKQIFDQVWRETFDGQGFYLTDEGIVDSRTLRQRMFEIKAGLSDFVSFGFRSMGRFDQQETTRFHQDGGPEHNILMLGYEPSNVQSRLYIADHSRAANDLGIGVEQLLIETMLGKDDKIQNYITELPLPEPGHSRILLINNSKQLGVLHKAVILNPDDQERRIINSMMLLLGNDEVSIDRQHEFLATDEVSRKY